MKNDEKYIKCLNNCGKSTISKDGICIYCKKLLERGM